MRTEPARQSIKQNGVKSWIEEHGSSPSQDSPFALHRLSNIRLHACPRGFIPPPFAIE
jgi:hypothetical protein